MPTGPDVGFETYPHAVTAGGVTRTIMQRSADIYNVRDYYQPTDGSNAVFMLQRAIDAANASSNRGGIIFIPPGSYTLSAWGTGKSRAYVGPFNNSATGVTGVGDQSLRFVGCGTHNNGTILRTSVRDYILYSSMHGTSGFSIDSIEGIGFVNNFTGTNVTQIEPPNNSPDGVSGDGCGCVYVGNGIGVVIRNCFLDNAKGVGYFFGGFQGEVAACSFQGGFSRAQDSTDGSGSAILDSVAIMSRALHIHDGKVGSHGIGIACFKGHSHIEFLDVERCGIGIQIGNNPYAYYDSNESSVYAAGAANFLAAPGVFINNIVMESNGEKFIDCVNASGEIRNVDMYGGSQVGVANYGLDCSGAVDLTLFRISPHGGFQIAGIKPGSNCQFERCAVEQTAGAGTAWLLPSTRVTDQGPMTFKECWTTGGRVLDAALPIGVLPPHGHLGDELRCSNSNLPFSTANIGKPIIAAGMADPGTNVATVAPFHRVIIKYSALVTTQATASFTTGSATISVPSGLGILNGMMIWDMSIASRTQRIVGTVAGYSGTTVTIANRYHSAAANSELNSAGANDTIVFGAWTIAG